MKLELKIDISRRTILFITLFLSAILIASATSFSPNQLLINQTTGLLFGNTSINQTTIVTDFLHGNGSNITSVNADTVDGYHLNQGVRTTDSPTFVGMNSTYANISGVNVTGAPCAYGFGGSHSYLICTDGTTVYAINGSTGAIEYSDPANLSAVLQPLIDAGKTPIFFKNGLYLTDSPLSKTNLNDVVEITSFNKYNTVPSVLTASNSVIIRANTSMETLFKFVGRGSISGITFDGNYRVTNTLSLEQTGTAVPRFLEMHGVNVVRANVTALNTSNSEAFTAWNSMFSDSQYGFEGRLSQSGTIYCYECYYQNNSVNDIVLNGTATSGASMYLFGGISANENTKPGYNATILMKGLSVLEAYGFWIDGSNSTNIRGIADGSNLPKVTLIGGRYAVASTSNQSNFVGDFGRIQQYGATDIRNTGSANDIFNATATTTIMTGYVNDSTNMNFSGFTRYTAIDYSLVNSEISYMKIPVSVPDVPRSGTLYFNGTALLVYNGSAWKSVDVN